MQKSLNSHYAAHDFPNSPYNFSPPLIVDGDFGSLTQSAVKDYQQAHGLEVDGQVGPHTWHSLGYC
ncbi:peptidoglycan-binding domain-containing protein [Dictyobacter halimunensis]|uniref:peptidoglycan-binding domain-containing protein n=1 Tax=Dictyobacter halimunensis TaxID=3026934 RepID=UPI0030C70632